MASTQATLKAPFKDLTSFKGNVKRLFRERLEDAPIKKRVMAEINLKRRNLEGLPRSPKVKRERLEDQPGETDLGSDDGEKLFHAAGGSSAKALDLSPGLKHTLAQFTLSSQISLGGPAAFSARKGHDPASPGMPAPLPSPAVLGGGPLLVPCDSSTELTHSALEGESISCFVVGGEKRLCLPQVLNSVLRDFSLQQINAVCDELYVYCSRCDADQLHVLKVLGVLPFNAPSCGLITLTDAQRLCNALLRPGATLPRGGGLATAVGGLLKESEANFQVEHQCLGKGQGLFVPHFYTQPDAPCIQCVECQLLFAPERFVMHSHRSPDKRTCHWGFDSAKWARYLQLGRKHLGTPEEARLKLLLEEMKEKFNCPLKRRLDKAHYDDDQVRSATSSLCSPGDKLSESDPGRKDQSLTTLVFNRLYADIKEEPIHTALLHPSCYLYTYDKGVPPNVSLPHSLRKDDESSPDVLGALLKRHYSEACRAALSLDKDVRTPPVTEIHTTISAATEAVKPKHGEQRGAVAMVNAGSPPTPATDTGVEDDKDRIVVEIVQMYSRQQEKLNSTLKKQLQLEMELEALRGGEGARLRELSAEQGELQSELEVMHSEHAQRLGAVLLEQQQLEQRLEQLRQQGCACEAHYTAQLSELRQRLDRAEADREELQEELQREREAREKLEHTISQLRRQMGESPLPAAPENAEVNLGPS